MDWTLFWTLLPLWVALALASVCGLAAHFALDLHRANRSKVDCGLSALRTLRWREFVALLRDVFRARGYEVFDEIVESGHSGAQLGLLRDGARHLVQIKHGEVYVLRADDVQSMIGLVKAAGAGGGILVSSGRLDPSATAAIRDQPIEILADARLWSQAKPFLTETLIAAARAAAGSHRRARRRRVATIMAVAGIVGFIATAGGRWLLSEHKDATANAVRTSDVAVAFDPADAPPTAVVGASAGVAAADDRQQVLSRLLLIDGMRSGLWSSKTTLKISVVRRMEIAEDLQLRQIRTEVCAVLSGFGQLRDSRLQMHLVDLKTGAEGPARFKLCD